MNELAYYTEQLDKREGAMDWMLTDEEIAEIEHDSHDICSRCEGDGQLWADGKAHYPMCGLPTRNCPNCDGTGRVLSGNEGRDVARAAARKVVEWIEHNSRILDISDLRTCDIDWLELGDVVVSATEVQALRQEVGLAFTCKDAEEQLGELDGSAFGDETQTETRERIAREQEANQ